MRRVFIWSCLVLAAACGDVTIADTPTGDAGDGQADGVTTDGAIDAAEETTGTGAECETPFDCLGLPGQSSCNVPNCVDAKCVLVAQPAGSACKDPALVLGDCVAA